MKKLTPQEMLESLYWYYQVRDYMDHQADWRYLAEATEGFLKGTHNQDYLSNDILWAVYKWREINGYPVDDLIARVDVQTS